MSISIPKVYPHGDEFGEVEQKLRIQLKCPSLVISEMLSIGLKPINVQFSNFVKAHRPTNIVDVFIPANQLQQSRSDVVTYGIKVHQRNGFTFRADGVDIELTNGYYEFIHIQVALGAVLNHQEKKLPLDKIKYIKTPPTIDALPEDYNSLRVADDRYCVFSPNQIKALHLIKFNYVEGVSNANPHVHECDMCHKHGASVYCYNDQRKFCEACDQQLHEQNDIMRDHKRVPLFEGLCEVQKCPEHPHLNVMYYCNQCHQAICLDCKVKGSHSHGEASKHKLLPIAQAYHETLFLSKKPDAIFVKREEEIQKGLIECERKLQEIQTNQQAVEDEIMRVAMKAIEDSRLQSCATANEVKSARLEYLRKLKELEEQKEILAVYRDEGDPVQFLQAASRKVSLQEEMKDNLDLPLPIKVKGDLIVYGRIEVGPPRGPSDQVADRGATETQSGTYSYTTAESSTLEPTDPKWKRLSRIAFKKQSKYDSLGIVLPFIPFKESRIIVDSTAAERLYLTLPFKSTPQPHLLYSTEIHSRNMRIMHKMIDEMGITCVIIKVDNQIFGGFAATKWVTDGIPKKDKNSSFLFQITKDAFIPFAGQSEDPYYICATQDSLQFGDGDIKLGGLQFEYCSSQLENSYGLGFVYGSQKSKEFMAGKHKFVPDMIEVWGFFQTE